MSAYVTRHERQPPAIDWRYLRRRLTNRLALGASVAAALTTVAWLFWILASTLTRGLAAFAAPPPGEVGTPLLHRVGLLFTESTPPPGTAGGLFNAFAGSLIMVAIAVLLGAPLGVLAGTYLGEFGGEGRFPRAVRFVNDILLSAPSIVTGLFVYAVVVVPMGNFSGLAGGISLALILLPIVVRTTDEMLRLVPQEMREAALALGAPRWLVVTKVSYRAAASGILTGILLAVARVSGETAPLLFTSLNNQFLSFDVRRPMANLPVVIFQFAMSPYEGWQQLAWAGALVAVVAVLGLNVVANAMLRRKRGGS